MKEKTKEFLKRYLIGFMLGIVSARVVIVYAETYFPSNDVTYDNTESGLKSSDVQGAIDELYGVCFPPKTGSDTITDLVDINTDELYKDDKENIRYYGKNPNNYVSFNNELWRIIGVIDGKIKIIRNESIGSKAWASNRYNNWNNSDLKDYLNGEYYNNIENTYRNMISEETYYLGGPTDNNYGKLTASEYYDVERSDSVYNGNPTSVNQYIGLMYPSDYGYAAGSSCLQTAVFNYSDGCYVNDYLSIGINEWLLSPYVVGNDLSAMVLRKSGLINSGGVVNLVSIRPLLYLKSDVKITGGDGSLNSPYEIEI